MSHTRETAAAALTALLTLFGAENDVAAAGGVDEATQRALAAQRTNQAAGNVSADVRLVSDHRDGGDPKYFTGFSRDENGNPVITSEGANGWPVRFEPARQENPLPVIEEELFFVRQGSLATIFSNTNLRRTPDSINGEIAMTTPFAAGVEFFILEIANHDGERYAWAEILPGTVVDGIFIPSGEGSLFVREDRLNTAVVRSAEARTPLTPEETAALQQSAANLGIRINAIEMNENGEIVGTINGAEIVVYNRDLDAWFSGGALVAPVATPANAGASAEAAPTPTGVASAVGTPDGSGATPPPGGEGAGGGSEPPVNPTSVPLPAPEAPDSVFTPLEEEPSEFFVGQVFESVTPMPRGAEFTRNVEVIDVSPSIVFEVSEFAEEGFDWEWTAEQSLQYKTDLLVGVYAALISTNTLSPDGLSYADLLELNGDLSEQNIRAAVIRLAGRLPWAVIPDHRIDPQWSDRGFNPDLPFHISVEDILFANTINQEIPAWIDRFFLRSGTNAPGRAMGWATGANGQLTLHLYFDYPEQTGRGVFYGNRYLVERVLGNRVEGTIPDTVLAGWISTYGVDFETNANMPISFTPVNQ